MDQPLQSTPPCQLQLILPLTRHRYPSPHPGVLLVTLFRLLGPIVLAGDDPSIQSAMGTLVTIQPS
jgi:hypothetical protein